MTYKKIFFWASILPIGVSLIASLIILFFFKLLPPRLPLFYSLPWGDTQLTNHIQFFIIPASLALITLLNLTIAWHLHPAQLFFKKILIAVSLVSTLILTITFIKIVLIFS